MNSVVLVECPHEGWAELAKTVPVEVKAEYLRTLLATGFKTIDAASFVSQLAVPQSADVELMLELLDPPDDVELMVTVVDAKGAERAAKTGAVQTLVFPYSTSGEFLRRNQGQTAEEALEALDEIASVADGAELDVVVRMAMAFGDPFGDVWSIGELADAVELMADSGMTRVLLVDDAGKADAAKIAAVFGAVAEVYPTLEFGLHLRSWPGDAEAKIRAGYEAGCRVFESALGGLGAAPFADDALVTNIRTEVVLATLKELGAELEPMRPLDGLVRAAEEIARRFGARLQ